MLDGRSRHSLQDVCKPGADLGDHIKAKHLDGHQLLLLGIERPKNWSQNATADLVQDAKGAESGRRGKSGGVVEWQRRNSLSDHVTLARGPHSL
jgi:hypothetical protein